MHQRNALALLDRVTGKDGVLPEELRWGEVPRYWRSEKGTRRTGYTRDGRPPAPLPEPAAPQAAGAGAALPVDSTGAIETGSAASAAAAEPLNKTGFRAIAVLFDDPG
jgi:hypothetical protein